MTDIFTVVSAPRELRIFTSFAERGRMTRADAIASVRKHYEHKLAEIQAFLALADNELDVRVVRGLHVSHLIEELKP